MNRDLKIVVINHSYRKYLSSLSLNKTTAQTYSEHINIFKNFSNFENKTKQHCSISEKLEI